jgi:hypothetical protein
MKLRLLVLAISFGSVTLAGAALAPASAASGLAYDSVTKLSMGADASTLQPGDFAADFKAASDVKPPQSGGGMFGALRQASGAMAALKVGTAERHYIAGSKERVDDIIQQHATIRDCAARTVTTLDLAKKTYRVETFDQLAAKASSGSSAPTSHGAPAYKDDGSKVAIALTNTALGQKQIDSESTNGYKSDMKMTVTKPGGESHTADMVMTAYYSNMARPSISCPGSLGSLGSNPQAAAMMGSYALAMRALMTPGNPRFSVSSSGPSLPTGKLPLFEVMTSEQGKGFAFVSERGNVRSINDSDPAFSVPSDFTKES